MRDARQGQKLRKKGRVKRAAGSVVFGVAALHGGYAQPQQNSVTTQHNWAGTTAQTEAGRQTRDMREGTRDRGNRGRSSSQR